MRFFAYLLIFFCFCFLIWMFIGSKKFDKALNAEFDLRLDLSNQIHILNLRDIENHFFDFEIRWEMYLAIKPEFQTSSSIQAILTWWNYKTSQMDYLELWPDLRFIDPDLTCDQLRQLVKGT